MFPLCFILKFGTLNEVPSVTINVAFLPLIDISHHYCGVSKISSAVGQNPYLVNYTFLY